MKLRSVFFISLLILINNVSFGAVTMSVQVKKEALRETPSFLSATLAILNYGDNVLSLNQKGDWMEVQSAKKKGWVHISALSTKEIILTAGATKARSGVSSNEVMMAGKGFNSQVESQYRQQNPTIQFDLVDEMERYSVPIKVQHAFAIDGKLNF